MATKEKMREYRKAYEIRHPERVSASKEAYRLRNLDYYASKTLEWRNNNPDLARLTEQKYLKTEKGRANIARKNTKRKALLYNANHEPYNRFEIYREFQGVCCICGDVIDLAVKHPDRMSFTIQHLQPLSRGGGDDSYNIAPAHYSCNSAVGNRVDMS